MWGRVSGKNPKPMSSTAAAAAAVPADAAAKKSKSTASKAGLLISTMRIEQRLRAKNRGRRVGKTTSVFFAGVVQKVLEDIDALAVAEARARNQKRVAPIDVQRVVRADPDLNHAFAGFAFGGQAASMPKAAKFVTVAKPTPGAVAKKSKKA